MSLSLLNKNTKTILRVNSKWKTALKLFGLWTIGALIYAINSTFVTVVALGFEGRVSLGEYFLWMMVNFYIFYPMLPIFFLATKRFFSGWIHWLYFTLVCLSGSLLLPFLHTLIYSVVWLGIKGHDASHPNPSFWSFYHQITISHFSKGLTVLAILLVLQVIEYYRKYQAEQIRTAQLKTVLAESQLQTLKAQLQPHFLFNTLNAISFLVSESPKTAITTITELSDLLRFSLKETENQETSLKKELDFLRKYVQIQQILLEERLEVHWKIADETLDAAVPKMILQPLVENAIIHGIGPLENGGKIVISAQKQDGYLHLCVLDNGQGLSMKFPSPNGCGIGLTNTRERLVHLYKSKQEFQLSEVSDGGVKVKILIPFRNLD